MADHELTEFFGVAEDWTPENMAEQRTEQTMTEDFFQHQVDRVVERIEQVAQHVRIEARVRPPAIGYMSAAASMVHALQWGVANVPLDSLLRAAADADLAVVSSVTPDQDQP